MVHVMVVEDDLYVRELLIDVLQAEGFQVTEAGDADAAIRLLRIQPLDLLVTDLGLPGPLDGIDLAMAARGRCPGLPIVFISGWTADAGDARVICDPTAFLPKPFRLRVFEATVCAIARPSGGRPQGPSVTGTRWAPLLVNAMANGQAGVG